MRQNQQLKQGTPYKMTVLMGYICGGEQFVQYYLDALAQAYQQENP